MASNSRNSGCIEEPFDGGRIETANGIHFAFSATSKTQVQNFYQAALEHGGSDDGEPGPRPDYGEPYYGCFVRDPDGHKIEAAFWDESKG
jgi:predicted lactoylglutathione lyase